MFKADLHIHTVLSPCGSLDMSPARIVQTALLKQIDIIGITDHNSTRQCRSVIQAAENTGLTVFTGVEITTKEEIHCLAFFENLDELDQIQEYLDFYLPDIKNNPDKFGYQVVVDKEENITYEEPKLLITGIEQSIDQVADKVHQLNGVFIPAHINKPKYSLISQLGFIPPGLQADAFEISPHISKEAFLAQYKIPDGKKIITNSDAHYLEQIGSVYNWLEIDNPAVGDFKKDLYSLKTELM